MTKQPPASDLWTPDQKVPGNASDEQLQARANWWVRTNGNRHADARVLLAREFAAAAVELALIQPDASVPKGKARALIDVGDDGHATFSNPMNEAVQEAVSDAVNSQGSVLGIGTLAALAVLDVALGKDPAEFRYVQ